MGNFGSGFNRLRGAHGGTVTANGAEMEYITFGKSGGPVLVMIPGLGDGLRTVRGMAMPFAFMYREYGRRFQVYVFSRKDPLEPEATTRSMAADLAAAMDSLGIGKASVLGVSQGGMIAQYLAIDYPQKVERLILAVTLSRQNETVQRVVRSWVQLAEAGDYYHLMTEMSEVIYTDGYLRKKHRRALYPLMGRIGKPKSFQSFFVQAHACLTHNAYEELGKIACPALVVGGGEDQVVGTEAAGEIAAKLPGSKLVTMRGVGHGAFEETGEFDRLILEWLQGTG